MPSPIVLTLQGVRSGPETVGNLVRLGVIIKNPATGDEVDPTTVRFLYLPPGERNSTTLTYGSGSGITKTDTGVYYTNLTLSEAGVWAVRWEMDGSYVGATEFSITVAPSAF